MAINGFAHPRRFIDEVPDDLKCSICLDRAITHSTPCEHNFCVYCINGHITNRIRNGIEPNCPICRKFVSHINLKAIEGQKAEQVKSLQVGCSGEAKGCTESGLLRDIERHEITCQYIDVPCKFRPRGCAMLVARKDADPHQSRCRFNPDVICCPFHEFGCKVRGTSRMLSDHKAKCKYRNHGRYVCCPNAHLGCGLRVMKYYLADHVNSCLFAPSVEPPGEKHCFRLCLAPKDSSKPPRLDEVKESLSNFLPNIKEVQHGPFAGEISVIFNKTHVSMTKGIGMATDPIICSNLRSLGLFRKGMTTVDG